MVDELLPTGCVNDGEPYMAPKSLSAEGSPPASFLSNPLCSEMSIPVLAARCLRELDHDRRGEPCTDRYGVELFRRATMQDNQEARAAVHHCFGGMVRGWLRCHPRREAACRLQSEEHYVAQAFERFWQATASHRRVEFSRLAVALQYLRASLHGTILDTLRACAQPKGVSRPVPGEARVEDSTDSGAVWDILKTVLSNARERCRELNGIEYFKTTIAIHSDRRWMPAQEKNWSVVNVRYDGKHASSTVWHPARSKRPVFHGWVTYDEELPSSLYALTTYVHPKVNPRYFQAQKHLLALQGRDHLWLAGLYMHDIDWHERAVVSAVKIARQLAPDSTNLSMLRLI